MCWVFSISLATAFFRSVAAYKACKTPPLRQQIDFTVCLTSCVNVQFTNLLIKSKRFCRRTAYTCYCTTASVTQSFMYMTSDKPDSEKKRNYTKMLLYSSHFFRYLCCLPLFFSSTLPGIIQVSQFLHRKSRMDYLISWPFLALLFYLSVSNCDIQDLLQPLQTNFP